MTVNQEWLTVSQAAKHVSRSRQTIDALARAGKIESKNLGEKELLHVYVPSLLKFYADKHMTSDNKQTDSKLDSKYDTQIEIVSVKAEAKRLSDLLTMNERLLSESKHEIRQLQNDLTKERNRNENLQEELLKLTKELHGALTGEKGLINWDKFNILGKKKK